jgi:hypothetical protein
MKGDATGDAIFCGCWGGLGHYYWTPGLRGGHMHPAGLPWRSLDSKTLMAADTRQGAARCTIKDGWTALAIHDYTVDRRPGSRAVFAFRGELGFDLALGAARAHFRPVVDRLEAAGPIYNAGE